jgi:hypothetical protein
MVNLISTPASVVQTMYLSMVVRTVEYSVDQTTLRTLEGTRLKNKNGTTVISRPGRLINLLNEIINIIF